MSLFGRIVKAGVGVAKVATKNPLLKLVPGVGSALGLAGVGLSAYDALKGSGGGGMPALPMLPGGSGGGGVPPGFPNPKAGNRGIFRNDANVTDELKPVVISKGDLRQYYRAPKGYVIMRDQVGDPMGVPKHIARRYGWKPAKKPLLSIRDTQALKHAGIAIKKLQKAEKMARHIANWHSPHKSAPRNIIVTGKTIGRKAA